MKEREKVTGREREGRARRGGEERRKRESERERERERGGGGEGGREVGREGEIRSPHPPSAYARLAPLFFSARRT